MGSRLFQPIIVSTIWCVLVFGMLFAIPSPVVALAWEDGTKAGEIPASNPGEQIVEPCGDAGQGSIYGMYPARIDDSTISFGRGWLGELSGGKTVFSQPVLVRINHQGLNGLDSDESASSDELYPYVVSNPKSKSVGIVLSSQISVSSVKIPSGYHLVRKLPWGFKLLGGAVPKFHFSGWGSPFTRYTDAATNEKWAAVEQFHESKFSQISLRKFIPDNARLAYIMVRVVGVGTGGGAGFIRVTETQDDGIKLGDVDQGQAVFSTLFQRITSQGGLYIRTTGNVKIDIWVLGYVNTEPS